MIRRVAANHRHHFRALTFDGKPILGRWKCRCGLKITSYSQARALEGTRL